MITVDAIKKSSDTDQIPLKWVGMEKVTLPIAVALENESLSTNTRIPCDFDVFVNLVNPSKGIHMSRIYEILDQYTQSQVTSISGIRNLLTSLIGSQKGLSTQARIAMSLALPVQIPTLKSGKSYFKSVPLKASFLMNADEIISDLEFQVDYSSTCPQSAALAHHLTITEMEKLGSSSSAELIEWYRHQGFVATPHAQRSQLEISMRVIDGFEFTNFPKLFLSVGQSLGTPTQGLVKRNDEQEFARLNANNLMFCEDAARRLTLFFKKSPWVLSGNGKVSHFESLHSHNAVAHFEF